MGFAGLGALCILGGAGLLVAGSTGTAQRLSRLAGILIVVGLALVVLGALGQL